MTQIEQLFLLEDVLYTYDQNKFNMINSSNKANFKLLNLPQELAISLEDEKIIMAFLTYYARYRMTLSVPEGLKPFVETLYSNPAKAVADFKFFLNENVLTDLLHQEIILPDPLDLDISGKLSKTATDKPIVELVDIEKDLGFDLKNELRKRLLSDNAKTRKTGLNLIGTITNEHFDLNELKDILLEFASLEGLTDAEKIEFIYLLRDWMSDYRVKSFFDKNFFIQIMQNYALNQPYGVKDKTLDILIEIEDGSGEFMSKKFTRTYLDAVYDELPYLSPTTTLKFFAVCYENRLIKKNQLADIIKQIPVPKDIGNFINKLSGQWEKFEKLFNFENLFIELIKASEIRRTDLDSRKFILTYLLAAPKRRANLLANINLLDHANFIVLLDTLKEIYFFAHDKKSLQFLNSLPVGYFENNRITEAVVQDESLQHFIELHKSNKMNDYLSAISENDPTTALKNYFKKAGLSPVGYNHLPFADVLNLTAQITKNMELNINPNQQEELASILTIRLSEFFDPFNDEVFQKNISIYDVIFADSSIQNPIRSFTKKALDLSEYQDDIKTLVSLFILIQNEITNYITQIELQSPPAALKITHYNRLAETSL